MTCKDCIYYERCDTVFDGLLSNRDNKPCDQFDHKSRYLKLPCFVGYIIYFIGYGVVETLKVTKVNIESCGPTVENYFGYVDALRSDGTIECIGFNTFGTLAFTNKEDAYAALEVAN